MLKLFYVTRGLSAPDAKPGEYEDCIVAAADQKAASMIHPGHDARWNGSDWQTGSMRGMFGWIDPLHAEVSEIGTALPDAKPGMLLYHRQG